MIENLRKSGLAAHVVDGPRGPAGEVQSGTIKLAHSSDSAIVPIFTSADRAWFFRSWDGFFVPKPFAKVVITFGDLIKYNSTETEEEFEIQRNNLGCIMRPRLIVSPHKQN